MHVTFPSSLSSRLARAQHEVSAVRERGRSHAYRGYVSKQGASLVPSTTGRLLAAFLEAYFAQWVDYGFSSDMERTLDDISAGERETSGALHDFWALLSTDVAAMKDVPVQEVRLIRPRAP